MLVVREVTSSPIVQANHKEVSRLEMEGKPVEEMDSPIEEEIMSRTTMARGTDLLGN